jgi:uncharacterized protein (DUF2147 family)
MFAMKAVCIATALVLFAGPAAHAGSIIDTLINESGVNLGKQKFGVKKSDISSMIKGFDIENRLNSVKSMVKEYDKAPATADRGKPTDTAPAARAEDWNVTPTRRDEPAVSRYDDRPAPRSDEKSSYTAPTSPVKDAVAPIEQKMAVAAPAPSASDPKASDPKSPVGEWITEDGHGHVRIRTCGEALCGVVSVADPNDTDRHNPDASKRNRPVLGLPVLIDMKPAKSNRWEGQIYNAKNGKTYASNISLKNPNVLRVEGCVFGGLFCGGQDWTRAKDGPQG